jgi:hypothetical protein
LSFQYSRSPADDIYRFCNVYLSLCTKEAVQNCSYAHTYFYCQKISGSQYKIVYFIRRQVKIMQKEVRTKVSFKHQEITLEDIPRVNPLVTIIKFSSCWAMPTVWLSLFDALSENKFLSKVKFKKCLIGYDYNPSLSAIAFSKLQQVSSITLSNIKINSERCEIGSSAILALSSLASLSELNLCNPSFEYR